MNSFVVLALVAACCLQITVARVSTGGRLNQHVKAYEPLNLDEQMFFQRNRFTRALHSDEFQFGFEAYGRTFKLRMKRATIFTSDVKFRVDGQEKAADFDLSSRQYYSGHVVGEKKSFAHFRVATDGTVKGSIAMKEDSYHIDPVDFHFDDKQPFNHVIYRGSDHEAPMQWLEERPVPQLGGPDLPYEKVAEFYDFWYNAKSWREFGYFDEDDPEQAESREEKRWIIRMNKAARKKKKKEEVSRMIKLIDNAFASDPRIKKHRREEKERKAAIKRAKAEQRQAEQQAIIDAQKKAEAEKLANEQAAKEAEKRDNEIAKKARRAFVKACKRSKLLEGKEYAYTVEVDNLKGSLTVPQLQAFAKLPPEEFVQVVNGELDIMREAKQAKEDKAKKAARPWTAEEQALLEEAMRTVPKDAPDRWKQIAANVPGRTKKDCVTRIKDLAAKVKEQKEHGPTEWTKEEEVTVIKAASKVFPPGTQGDRWGQIAEYLKTHAHTEWRRTNKDVIAKVNSLKNVDAVMNKKKAEEAAGLSSGSVNVQLK